MRTAALAALTPFALALAAPAVAQAPTPPPMHAHGDHHMGTMLSLSAESTVQAKPDKATITLGVQTDAATAQAASQANAQAMTNVMAALRRARIAERDVQTANLSLNPQYRYEENKSPTVTGYQASNTVLVTVRDLANLGRAMDAVVAAGGNTVQGVTFGLEKQDSALDVARRDALAKARARAELYAQAAGMKVARIVQISEGGGYAPPMPMPMMRMQAAEASTPVAPGELSLTATVSVVFELE